MSDVLVGYPLDPREGDRYRFDQGEIRVDGIERGEIYFVQWQGDEVDGHPARMTLECWREAVGKLTGWTKPAHPDAGKGD